mmetsp:Transcript_10861/g.24006  ORF Transcript_10861/g.24006 Transcript_10861/m.24006 type:complete len:347 (-) Transcript_10861:148-1188(-)
MRVLAAFRRTASDEAFHWRHAQVLFAAASAGLVLSPPARCYFEKKEDGTVDRLKKWSTVSWSLPPGREPGFHLSKVNPLLANHFQRLVGGAKPAQEGKRGPPILVPLCGKTVDMVYFAEQGYSVVGIEGVKRALVEFRRDQRSKVIGFAQGRVFGKDPQGKWKTCTDFQPATSFEGPRPGYAFKTGPSGLGYYADTPRLWSGLLTSSYGHQPIHVLEGDYFTVTKEMMAGFADIPQGEVEMAFDRGSLVAVPPSARDEYVKILQSLIKEGGRILAVVVDYDQEKMPNGPPFSVPLAEIKRLYPDHSWTVEVLETVDSDLPDSNPKFRGLVVKEHAILITKKVGATR